MALAQEDIELIKTHLGVWLAEHSFGKPPVVYEIELRERMVRVKEALRHQRARMQQGCEQIDRRLDAMRKRHDRQFLWLIGFIASGFGLLLAAIRYL